MAMVVVVVAVELLVIALPFFSLAETLGNTVDLRDELPIVLVNVVFFCSSVAVFCHHLFIFYYLFFLPFLGGAAVLVEILSHCCRRGRWFEVEALGVLLV